MLSALPDVEPPAMNLERIYALTVNRRSVTQRLIDVFSIPLNVRYAAGTAIAVTILAVLLSQSATKQPLHTSAMAHKSVQGAIAVARNTTESVQPQNVKPVAKNWRITEGRMASTGIDCNLSHIRRHVRYRKSHSFFVASSSSSPSMLASARVAAKLKQVSPVSTPQRIDLPASGTSKTEPVTVSAKNNTADKTTIVAQSNSNVEPVKFMRTIRKDRQSLLANDSTALDEVRAQIAESNREQRDESVAMQGEHKSISVQLMNLKF